MLGVNMLGQPRVIQKRPFASCMGTRQQSGLWATFLDVTFGRMGHQGDCDVTLHGLEELAARAFDADGARFAGLGGV